MKTLRLAAALSLFGLLGACISPPQEDAKLRMPWPAVTEPGLVAYAQPRDNYPTIGGNILKGTAPQILADDLATTPSAKH